MKLLHSISLILHITAGAIALLSGLMAIVFRKDTKRHRPVGKIYFACMTVIFITAIAGSYWRSNLFLFGVAFFTFYSAITAYRSLYLKKLHLNQPPKLIDLFIELFFGIVHLSFVIFAVIQLLSGDKNVGIISLVFGFFGIWGNYGTIRRIYVRKLDYKNYWLLAHIRGMCGSYIGAITAFMVNNNRWLHLPDLVTWLGPTALLVPLLIIEINNNKKKAGKLKTTE